MVLLLRHRVLICSVIFLVGFILRVGIDWRKGSYNYEETPETVGIARSLVTQGTFADAYGKTGPTAHSSPLYPLLLSFLFRIFGIGHNGLIAAALFGTALACLQYSLLPLLATAARIPVQAGFLAGALGALLPINYWVQTKGVFEYSLSALLMVSIAILYLHCLSQRDFRLRMGICLGLLCGAALLTVPPFVLPLMALAVSGYFVTRRRVRLDFVKFAFVHLAIAGVMVLPWMIRNENVLGAPVWGRSNFGLELHLSNNDLAAATWDGNKARGNFLTMHPSTNDGERIRVREVGEIAYNREKLQEAKSWIAAHPLHFMMLTAERAFLFWFPDMMRATQTVALGVVTLAGIAGFVLFWRTGAPASRYFLILCVFTAAPLCLFQASGRLRYPIEWTFYLFSAYLIYRLSLRAERPKPQGVTSIQAPGVEIERLKSRRRRVPISSP